MTRELGKWRGLENRISEVKQFEAQRTGVWVWVAKVGHNAPHPTSIIKATMQGVSLTGTMSIAQRVQRKLWPCTKGPGCR